MTASHCPKNSESIRINTMIFIAVKLLTSVIFIPKSPADSSEIS